MDSERKKITYIQCQTCGDIYSVKHKVAVDVLYVNAHCPNCGITTGLNLGDSKEDLYFYWNENFDRRYY